MSDFEDEDFFKDLENDLQENNLEVELSNDLTEEGTVDATEEVYDNDNDEKNDISYLVEFIKRKSGLLTKDLGNIGHKELLSIYTEYLKIGQLLNTIDIGKNTSNLLNLLNDILSIIQGDFTNVYSYIKIVYKLKFPELDTILTNPTEVIGIIKILEDESTDILNSDLLLNQFESKMNISSEKRLVLIMSIKTLFNNSVVFHDDDRKKLFQTMDLLELLSTLKLTATNIISKNIFLIAPNLCALVGPSISSLLIAHTGSIVELSKVPSCNIASIGKNKALNGHNNTFISGVRQEGYVYSSDLIQSMPISTHKQLLRMLCAKVSLASRVDAGLKSTDTNNNSLGIQWKEEILEKIKKLQEAPNVALVKPLPIPQDSPKKKRAGRKFRKYKEQFQLSNLRQLQNRMQFGKQEQSYLDSNGEEVGLGMMNSSLKEAAGVINGNITKRTNNSAKITKKLKNRLQDANAQSQEYLYSLENQFTQDT